MNCYGLLNSINPLMLLCIVPVCTISLCGESKHLVEKDDCLLETRMDKINLVIMKQKTYSLLLYDKAAAYVVVGCLCILS